MPLCSKKTKDARVSTTQRVGNPQNMTDMDMIGSKLTDEDYTCMNNNFEEIVLLTFFGDRLSEQYSFRQLM